MFSVPIVGTSHCDDTIERLVGGPTEYPHFMTGWLYPVENEHDEFAVGVFVAGERVGYLSRDINWLFRDALNNEVATCRLAISGGVQTSTTRYSYTVEADFDPTSFQAGTAPLRDPPSLDCTWRTLDGRSYTVDGWLPQEGVGNLKPKLDVMSWTTETWDSINYYLKNAQGIGLGHRVAKMNKSVYTNRFGPGGASARVDEINGRVVRLTLYPV